MDEINQGKDVERRAPDETLGTAVFRAEGTPEDYRAGASGLPSVYKKRFGVCL